MIPWMRQERSLLTGKGAFLWVQNDLHISSVSLKLQSEGMHPSSSGCVAGGTSHLTVIFGRVQPVTLLVVRSVSGRLHNTDIFQMFLLFSPF